MKEKDLLIRSSTSEFLTFTAESGADSIEVLYAQENVWATQDMIALLYGIDRSGVTKHLGNIFRSGELDENAVCAKFARTAADGKTYHPKFYSLEAIIAVGFRIDSETARFCPSCGQKQEGRGKYCPDCGHELEREDLKFCTECGGKL